MMVVHVPRQGVLPASFQPTDLAGEFNGGLLFQRYLGLPRAQARGKEAEAGSDVMKAARAFTEVYNALPPEPKTLGVAHRRLDALGARGLSGIADAAWDHWTVDLKLVTRLAIGLGNEHPFENGLTFHPTLGVPTIPGTTLKGLARSWRVLLGEDKVDEWFGQGPGVGEGDGAGSLIFYEALPLKRPTLEVDLVNCHLPGYYRGSHNPGAVPKESPVPAAFAVVAPGCTFRFRVGARWASGRRDAEEAREGLQLLQEALGCAGVGSKTSAGYGYFELEQRQHPTGR